MELSLYVFKFIANLKSSRGAGVNLNNSYFIVYLFISDLNKINNRVIYIQMAECVLLPFTL